MSAAMYSDRIQLTPALYARRVRAARRRAETARARADRNPTPTNQEAATELEAGLQRLEGLVPA